MVVSATRSPAIVATMSPSTLKVATTLSGAAAALPASAARSKAANASDRFRRIDESPCVSRRLRQHGRPTSIAFENERQKVKRAAGEDDGWPGGQIEKERQEQTD